MTKKKNSELADFEPLGDRILVLLDEAQKVSDGGILIPDTAQHLATTKGEVIAVGPGRLFDDGTRNTINVAIGDRVLISKYGTSNITLDGKDCVITDESQVYARLKRVEPK